MKKYIAVIVFSILSISAFAQGIIEGKSSPMTVNITKDISRPSGNANVITGQSVVGMVSIIKDKDITAKPPRLQADAPQYNDTDGNNVINANESYSISFTLSNMGEGPALNLTATVSEKNKVPGLSSQPIALGNLPPGKMKTFEVPGNSSLNTTNSTASLVVSVGDANGNGIVLSPLTVQVKAYEPPLIKITDVVSSPVMKGVSFTVTVNVQNTGAGAAENVILILPPSANIVMVDGSESVELGSIASGETKQYTYTLITKPNYTLAKIILSFQLKERFGKYADNSKGPTTLLIGQQLASNKNVVTQGEQQNVPVAEPKANVAATSFISDVDNITPSNFVKNPKRIALIIGNENYSQYVNAESNVDYAKNDATVFKKYAINVFGIEEDNVFDVYDATSSIMRTKIDMVALLLKKMGPSSELIFYYAGHGFPDEVSKIPYLIPVDVSGTNLGPAIKLADLYTTFGSSGAGKMVVFLDACFSGGGRSQSVLPARGVRMEPNTGEANPSGNMIVFSASKGQQSALALDKEKHGLFTYYLLKKLKEPGAMTYEQLFNYIYEKVSIDAVKQNSKEQDPDIIISPDLGDKWKTWKVK
jgi:hypothetical protein